MKFLILLTVVAYVRAGCSPDDILKCNTIEATADPSNFKWPATDPDVQALCSKLLDGGKCLRDLTASCLTGQDNEAKLFNGALDKEKQILTDMCASEASRGQFLNRVQKCYTKPDVIFGVENIHKRYVGMIEALAPLNDNKGNVAPICCAVIFNHDNVHDINAKYCDAESADYIHKLVSSVFGPGFEHYCGKATNYQTCLGNLPANIQDAFNKITSADKAPATKYSVALPTLVDLLKNMPA